MSRICLWRRMCLVFVALLSVPGSASRMWAQQPDLRAQIEQLRTDGSLPAVAAAVFSSDSILAVSAVGVRSVGSSAEVTLGDLWHIGSLTKTFTSVLVAREVERGGLSWSDTLGGVVGDRARSFAGVSLVQLLSHRAGLPANVPNPLAVAMVQSSLPLSGQRAGILDSLLSLSPASRPGESFVYSNAGYIMAGAILEGKLGASWEDLLRRDVLVPARLPSAGFGPPGTAGGVAGVPQQPRGHRLEGARLVPVEPGPGADNPPFLGPAGTLHMTIGDLARWGQQHLRGERGVDGVVTAASFKRLHEPPLPTADYALGWVVRRNGDQRIIWHNGSNTMWYALLAFDPAANLGVAIVTNGGIGAAPLVDAALGRILGAWMK